MLALTPALSMTVLLFTITALFIQTPWAESTWAESTTVGQKALAIELDATSAKAMGSLERRFGPINDLLYLYPVNEKETIVELGFPGELIVAPDKTKLSDLLSTSASKIRINAEPDTLSRLFLADAPPAARIVNKEKRLVGIVATQKAMEPFRTGAVLRSTEKNDAAPETDMETETAAKAVEHPADKDTPQPTEADNIKTAAHAPAKSSESPTAQTQDAVHEPQTDTHQTDNTNQADITNKVGKTDHGEAPQAPAALNPEHTASEETASQEQPAHSEPAHSEPAHQPPVAESHGKPTHGPTFDASLPRGVNLIAAIIHPLDYELNERFWGWRPNDLIDLGDNVRNFQLGVLEITRRTAIILSERVSRTGESARFDPQLRNAMNWFMIKPNRYWFPSAESKYQDALDALTEYKERLAKNQAKFFNRADNLIPLLMAYEDLMGSCEENLVKATEEDGASVSFFKADNYLYYTKGVTSALLTILTAIEHDFGDVIASRQAQGDIHHAITSCRLALKVDPTLVMNSHPSSIFANHRANLAAPISHVRFYLSVLIKTLST